MYFKRNHQYWKINAKGKILLINTKVKNHHYDGEAHIFLDKCQFNQDFATKIDKKEFDGILKAHIDRLEQF